MVTGVIWSQEALDDIQAIAAFIGRDSAFHAQRVVEEIFTIGDSIPEQPRLGRMVPELQDPNLRERFIYSYRIMKFPGSESKSLQSSMAEGFSNRLGSGLNSCAEN